MHFLHLNISLVWEVVTDTWPEVVKEMYFVLLSLELLVAPSPRCLEVYSGFWMVGLLLFWVLLSNQARMVITLSRIRV